MSTGARFLSPTAMPWFLDLWSSANPNWARNQMFKGWKFKFRATPTKFLQPPPPPQKKKEQAGKRRKMSKTERREQQARNNHQSFDVNNYHILFLLDPFDPKLENLCSRWSVEILWTPGTFDLPVEMLPTALCWNKSWRPTIPWNV